MALTGSFTKGAPDGAPAGEGIRTQSLTLTTDSLNGDMIIRPHVIGWRLRERATVASEEARPIRNVQFKRLDTDGGTITSGLAARRYAGSSEPFKYVYVPSCLPMHVCVSGFMKSAGERLCEGATVASEESESEMFCAETRRYSSDKHVR